MEKSFGRCSTLNAWSPIKIAKVRPSSLLMNVQSFLSSLFPTSTYLPVTNGFHTISRVAKEFFFARRKLLTALCPIESRQIQRLQTQFALMHTKPGVDKRWQASS